MCKSFTLQPLDPRVAFQTALWIDRPSRIGSVYSLAHLAVPYGCRQNACIISSNTIHRGTPVHLLVDCLDLLQQLLWLSSCLPAPPQQQGAPDQVPVLHDLIGKEGPAA